MKKNIFNIVVVLLATFNVSIVAQAGSYTSCGKANNKNYGSGDYDYGDAVGYKKACHDTNRWQQLGDDNRTDIDGNSTDSLQGDTSNKNDDDNAGWSSESSQNGSDTGDNGVTWSTYNAGTGTWSEFGITDTLIRGADVKFKFSVKRSTEGNHKFDRIKAWVDWYGDNITKNGNTYKAFNSYNDEMIYQNDWYKDQDSDGQTYTGNRDNQNRYYNNDLDTYNSDDFWGEFITTVQVPIDAILGETWLRARVVCENSLHSYSKVVNGDYMLSATGYQHQGETEDYRINIAEVPEPSTLALFALGVIGLLGRSKKVS